MSFKRRLKKEREKQKDRQGLKTYAERLEAANKDARRFNEISMRIDEIEKAPVFTRELQAELAALSEEIASIRRRIACR